MTIGYVNTASETGSCAIGSHVTASGNNSCASGYYTTASGTKSRAENEQTVASGSRSHSEGYKSTASGSNSHAEGASTEAAGDNSHAEGKETVASNYSSHVSGKCNKTMTVGGTATNTTGDVFVVGNGTGSSSLSNALRLAYEGTLYLTKAYKSTGADYAEYFEWLDGNTDAEDRVGLFVTLEGNKIKLAQEGDYILGVVSGQPCIIGNADEDWLGRWEHDEFGRFVKEYLVHTEVEVDPSFETDDEIIERDGKHFMITTEVVDFETPSWRHKANPNYDPSQPYIERQDRKEWDAVGMLGMLSVIDDGTCKIDSYAKVSTHGIATASTKDDPDSYRVIDRITPNVIKIVFK